MAGGLLTITICLAGGLWFLLTSVNLVRKAASGESVRALRIRQESLLPRLAGLVLGSTVAYFAVERYDLGVGQLLAVPIVASGLLMGVLAGEVRVPLPRSTTRRASIEFRRTRNYLPARMLALVGVVTGVLILVLTATTITAAPDDLGRAGRALRVVCADDSVSQLSPWPGVFYSVPAAIVILTGLLLGAITLRRITNRPRIGSDAASRLTDDNDRRRSGQMVVAAFGLLVSGPLIGTALVSGSDLLQSCGSLVIHAAGWALIATGIATIGVFCWLTTSILFMRPPRGTIER